MLSTKAKNKILKNINDELDSEFKRKYLVDHLLKLTTDGQRTMFNRIYPDGVPSGNYDHAIYQIENTLRSLNEKNEKKQDKIKELEKTIGDLKFQIKVLTSHNMDLKTELNETNRKVKQLSSTESVNTADILERLEWLDALEAAGVDNWNGYDYAREILNEK